MFPQDISHLLFKIELLYGVFGLPVMSMGHFSVDFAGEQSSFSLQQLLKF